MKKLTKMKLINWHRFENCLVEFGGSTLLSGENGAGKTTLLDAIQFVILCSAGSFNKAAHENGKRKLTGYIRCKSGKETKPYERMGEISAHVALEFYEEKQDAYFIIGAVVDSPSENQETTVRYLIDGERLSDEMFFEGDKPRSISQFHAAVKIRKWCKTQAEARKMVTSRLGRIENKFFRLIPKALAFKPIDNIKDFVYSYVLDEKDVQIDSLRENVRAYQDLERTLESVRKRIEELEQIEQHHAEVQDCERRDRMYEYFLVQSDADILKGSIVNLQERTDSDRIRKEELEKEKTARGAERDRRRQTLDNLRLELMNNEDYLALENVKKEERRFEAEEEKARREMAELKAHASRAAALAEKLLKIPDPDPCFRDYRNLLSHPEKIQDAAQAKELTERVIACKNEISGKMHRQIAEANIRLDEKNEEYQKLRKKISDLENKKLTYPESVERLILAVREEFVRLGRKAQPRVLCELLEINDEDWRNAVEGYLNTQRFYVLVEPENFDIALGVYDRLRREGKAYGAGLINARKLEKYDTAPAGTLAEKVDSRNRYARRYINLILGKVQMCERYEDLKKYPVSITKGCMRYQNRVASAIRPEIFEVPFIGKEAFRVQLEQARKKEKELRDEQKALAGNLREMEKQVKLLSAETDYNVQFHLDAVTGLREAEEALRQCRENRKALEKNTTLIEKQIQVQRLEEEWAGLEKEYEKLIEKIGGLQNSMEAKESQKVDLQKEFSDRQKEAAEIAGKAGEEFAAWKKEYDRQTSDKTYEQFHANFERQRKANATSRAKLEEAMQECMYQYKSKYDFGAAATMEGYAEFAAVYDRLKDSELLEYEEKVQTARDTAEQEFREQFLAHLQENIKQAQSEFRELNRALKDITFSNERYEFLYMPGKRNRRFYDMIMDDFNAMEGESIFSGIFHEQHKEVIEELFDRLAVDNENNEKALTEFTDYRSYMDYDIRIIHEDGSFSYYSKVCEEKSGGETQTPFYVTVAASFVQLYTNNIGGEAAGLVLFDEAFNNMDDERIGGVLQFFNRLPLQVIISAPPEKIQYIAPEMSETLLIMTDGKISYVEEYHIIGNGRSAE